MKPTTLLEILREKHSLITCGCLLSFTNILFKCELGTDVVSTWPKLDGCTDKQAYPVMSSHYDVL